MSRAQQILEARNALEQMSMSLGELGAVLDKLESSWYGADELAPDADGEDGGDLEAELEFATAWVSQAMDAMADRLCFLAGSALPDRQRASPARLHEILQELAVAQPGQVAEHLRAAAGIAADLELPDAADIAEKLDDFLSGSHPASGELKAIQNYEILVAAIDAVLTRLEEKA